MENVRLVRSQWPGRSRTYERPKAIRRPTKRREPTYEMGFEHGFVAATVLSMAMAIAW